MLQEVFPAETCRSGSSLLVLSETGLKCWYWSSRIKAWGCYFKNTRVLCDGHNVPLIGVCWGWEAPATAGRQGRAGRETVRFSEIVNAQFDLRVVTGALETWEGLCTSVPPSDVSLLGAL